jgi:hypothetical protein
VDCRALRRACAAAGGIEVELGVGIEVELGGGIEVEPAVDVEAGVQAVAAFGVAGSGFVVPMNMFAWSMKTLAELFEGLAGSHMITMLRDASVVGFVLELGVMVSESLW